MTSCIVCWVILLFVHFERLNCHVDTEKCETELHENIVIIVAEKLQSKKAVQSCGFILCTFPACVACYVLRGCQTCELIC